MLRSSVNLTLDEAKSLYKGCTVKNRGYHPDEGTQFLYKSEVNKKQKIICLLQGQPYVVPTDIHENFRSHLSNGTPLVSGVVYENEQFVVPVKYLVNYATLEFNQPQIKDTTPKVDFGQPVTMGMHPIDHDVSELMDAVNNLICSDPLSGVDTILNILPYSSIEDMLQENISNCVIPAVNGDRTALVKLISNILLLNKQKNAATK